jgi:hypothetical protein
VTRGTKLGGCALALAGVCLLSWVVFGEAEGIRSVGRFFRYHARKATRGKRVPSPRMVGLPNVYLWAWERREDLRFLAGRRVGVAFLAKTLYLKSGKDIGEADELGSVVVRPRMQPLRIAPGTPLMAVVRIETLARTKTSAYAGAKETQFGFSEKQLAQTADEIAATVNMPGVNAVQIDFDATLSEHDFYRALLVEVRKRLANEIPLSITALASWCIGDRWLEQLPPGAIDEAVPMVFRMGTGEREIVNYVSSGEEFRVAACGSSVGVSTDEAFSREILVDKIAINRGNRNSQRIYIFSPEAWDQVHAETALEEIQRWHAN